MIHILIVDDEEVITEHLANALTGRCSEISVHVSNSGYGALGILLKQAIDLVITDIAMADMNGFELYQRIKNMYENLPVIMMTGFGYDPDHTIIKAKMDGLQDVIFKPFNIDKLLKLIKDKVNADCTCAS